MSNLDMNWSSEHGYPSKPTPISPFTGDVRAGHVKHTMLTCIEIS